MSLDKDLIKDIMLQADLAADEQVEEAAAKASEKGSSILDELVLLGASSQEVIYSAAADKLGFPYIDILNYLTDPEAVKLFPMSFAVENLACPLFLIEDTLTVGMADPTNFLIIDRIRARTGYETEACLCSEVDLKQAIEQNYGGGLGAGAGNAAGAPGHMEPGAMAGTSVSRLMELILTQAVRDKVSDIHIEPEEKSLRIRFRVDGLLHEVPAPSKQLEAALISRVKIMANMDIATNRIPQDGHFRVNIDGKNVDSRVSTIPTIYGENVVIRLLASSNELIDFDSQGMSPEETDQFEEMISHPWGMVLATGPTGSGKTTTLYSALARVNSMEKNIITIEDPVEIRLPLIRQIEVSPQVGLTFANGLRSIVRQDPDIIMVGEIRDPETAAIAVQAALTGHMVFSTLHTNDAAGAVTRMVDMGIEPFLLSGSLTGVVAQRLLRRICQECKQEYKPSRDILKSLGIDDGRQYIFYKSAGCSLCKGTGYRGRVGIFELLRVTDTIRDAITRRESTSAIKRMACEEGMQELKKDGLAKALQGITSIDEVARVTEIGVDVRAPLKFSQDFMKKQEKPPEEPGSLDVDDYKQRIASWISRK